MTLLVLYLECAQDLVPKLDGVNHQHPHVCQPIAQTALCPHIAHYYRFSRLHGLQPERFQLAWRRHPVRPSNRAAIRKCCLSAAYAIYPEVAPIEKPVRQALDLRERPLERRVARDRRLHEVNLIQVFGADRFIEDLARQETKN